MIKPFFTLLIFVLITNCKQHPEILSDSKQTNTIVKKDTIAIWGNFDFNKNQAIEFVAQDWNLIISHFPFVRESSGLAPSMITEMNEKYKKESESINKKLWKKLDANQQIKSQSEFENQVDIEFNKISQAQKLFDKNSIVQDYLKKTYKKGQFIIPTVRKKKTDSIYVWHFWKIYEIDDELSTNEPYAEFIIDLKDETIIIEKSDQ